jgi:phytoene synthase
MIDQSYLNALRRADPDRMLATSFAPAAKRPALFLLYAFNHELARAREVASSGPMALIRLHWWREVIDGADRRHPVAVPLRQALAAKIFTQADLLDLIDARAAEAEPIPDLDAFMAYARCTAGALMRIAGIWLGADRTTHDSLERLGTGTGIAFMLRAAPALRAFGRDLLPQDGTHLRKLAAIAQAQLATPTPNVALAATLPSILARRDLARLDQRTPIHPRGLGDRLAVIKAGLLGRIGPSPRSVGDGMIEG